MPSVPTSELVALQANTQNIRNLCVLAHVDHGKTTLSDALISSNGIISDKLAGKIRYMDNRKDEQLREITMKSSAISLLYRNAKEEPFLINLIDSPGHVDFSGEVSSAVRLCDGGFLVVDAVEGVCVQTDTVMRQAWKEKLKPVLVINKIDRLFMELQMGPDEAAEHLKKLLAVVNVSVATLMLEQQYEKGNQKNSDNAKAAATEEAFQRSQRPKGPPVSSSSSSSSSEGVTSFTVSLEGDSSWKLEEVNDDDIYFSPELGNVLFCSAIDGWGFRTTQFAEFYSKKMGFSKGALEKALWGEHYFDPKTKKVFGNSRGGKLKQMFTELVMRPLHQLYDSTVGSRDETKLKKICSVLGLSLTDRILGQLQTDPRYILTQVARQWIPLSPALIEMAIEHLPSPVDGQKSRADTLFRPLPSTISQEYRDEYERVKESVAKCESHADLQANPESSEAPVVIYISKMFTAPLGYGSSVQDSGPRIAMPKARKPIFTAAPHSSASPAPAAAVTPAPAPANPLSGSGSGSGEGSSLSSSGSSSASSESEETEKHLQGLRSKVMTGERFVGFARIFSGTVKIGQMLHVYGPKYDPLFPDKHHALVQCEELYLLMGRGLEPLREVPAGNVFGISGSQLPRHILKTGSLSTSACCPIFSDMVFSKPIMRVAVEPLVPAEMPILIEGLKLLNQADASVEIMVQESGEHVIVASGEVHLERCVTDLKEMFAPIELKFSSPIVGFREGLIQDPTRTGGIVIQPKDYLYAQMNLETIQSKDLLKEAKRGQIAFKKSLAQAMTRNKACVVTVRAIPLPDCIRDALELLGPQIKQVFIDHPNKSGAAFHSLQQKLLKSFIEAGNQWSSEFDKIWSIGPKRMGPNILFNHIGQICNSPFWKSLCSTEEAVRITLSSEDQGDVEKKKEEKPERAEGEEEEEEEEDPEAGLTEEEKWTISKIQEFEPSIVSAFQLTTQSGPLCEEPMMGVAFFIESLTIKNLPAEKMDDGGPIKGQVMSAVKEAGRQAFSKLPNRLIEPYYDCQLQVSTEQYGNACSVLSRRRAKIVGEELKEGTNIFILNAKLPVVSSFGLALEMMKKTSGAANAQLKFSHWELLDLDPDFVPTTAEELEEHGTNTGGIAPNLAKQLINDVRKRKGLYVDEQLVEHADKQRTLSKNK